MGQGHGDGAVLQATDEVGGEAGGVLSTLEGRPMDYTRRCSVWASNRVNGDILRELEV